MIRQQAVTGPDAGVPVDDPVPVHLLVETRGPWAGAGYASFLADAAALAGTGQRVRLLLLQDGVVAAAGQGGPALDTVLAKGAEVWVDRFSADQRGLRPDELDPAVRLVEMDEVARVVLLPDARVVWH
jgi:hypothetical protein